MDEISSLSEDSEGHESVGKIEELSKRTPKSESYSSAHGLQMLRTRVKLLEHSLEDQRITSSYLREERDKAVDLNRALQREVEEVRREGNTGKTRSSYERQSKQIKSLHTGPLREEQTVAGYVLALPRKFARGLVNRVALFVWWTGVWVNQGLGMLRIENKWVEVERIKCELEQENAKLRQQIYGLQKLLTEREYEILAEIERNKELRKRVNKKGGSVPCNCGRNHSLEAIANHVHAFADFSDCLSQEIETLKEKMHERFAQYEKVRQDIDRLTEGQRLLERKVKTQSVHDSHRTTAEPRSQEFETEKQILSSKEGHEEPESHCDGNENHRIKMVKPTLSGTCRLICYGVRNVVIFLFTFLALGFLFHFLLISSSMRLPSTPVDEYYGVDLFALWCYFVNWMFSLLVTE